MNKIFRLYILLILFFSAGVFAFADQPNSSLDDKPSVDTAASAGVQVPVAPADINAADTHASYLYDLRKLIAKSRENIKEVNEKIKEQAVLKRNQKREERARQYYEKGMALTNDGKLDEAREYFEKAISITEHPEMSGYIKESQRRLKRQEDALHSQQRERYNQIKQDESSRKEDVEAAYKEAVDLYKQRKYHPAKDAFEHVDEIAPDYRATSSYLKILDQDIITSDALAAKQQAVEIEHQQKEAEIARIKEKQMWLQQIEEKEKEHKEAINNQAEEVYAQAIDLYKAKKFAAAKKKFEEVSWVIPNYKATMKYLGRIDRDAQEEEERVAQEQKKALQQQRWEEEVERKKQEVQRQLELEAKERQHKQDLQEQAQFLYTAAVALYDQKNMDEALEKFNDIEKLYSDFKSTRVYIARVGQWKFEQQKKVLEAQELESRKLEAQRQREELERKRQEAEQEREKQAKELQRQRDFQKQVQSIYSSALAFFDRKSMGEALEEFKDLEKLSPDYKSTRIYIARIEQMVLDKKAMEEQQKQLLERQAKEPQQAIVVPSVQAPTHVDLSANSVINPPLFHKEQSSNNPPLFYKEGLGEFKNPTPSSFMPAQVRSAINLEDQQKQAQDIAALAEKSAQLYHQIADISNDRSTAQTKRKMAQVDKILKSLKENKERLLRQMHQEEWKRQQEETKAKQEERRAQAEKMYQEAMEYLRSHDYAKAKIKFMGLENIIPDYKAAHRYLSRIEEDQKQENAQAVTNYEKNEAAHLKQLQDKENAEAERRTQQEQEKQRNIEQEQQAALQNLAQKASAINDDIILLSRQQDYEAMKAKFTELENTVAALTTLKDAMAKKKDLQGREKELARESTRQRADMLRSEKREDRQIRAYYKVQPLKEYRPVLSDQPSNADHFKRRDIMQEQNMLFSEGVDRYEHKKYTQAKLLFGELADQHDRRAEVWLKKVDRAITRELLRSQEGEERERTAFISDQLRAQRQLAIIQERERDRQKKLTEELEHQKRLFEDNRLLQLRKEETMKVQDRERQHQEEKRLQLEKENTKQQATFRFHKIETNNSPKQPVIASAAKQSLNNPPLFHKEGLGEFKKPPVVAKVQPPTLTPKQLKAQVDFSNKRKAFLDSKYKKEQNEQARQAKIKARADAIQKRKEERQAKIKAEAEAREKLKEEKRKERERQESLRAEQEKAKSEKLAQEEKHREEVLRQQQQEREEKIKKEEIVREEAQRRQELERQGRQQQAQLEAQRAAIRKQLEDGVETMYQEAQSLYKQGEYTAAADKFKDVQDILPGYKRSGPLMDEARLKSLEVKSQPVITPAASVPSSAPASHQDSVSKALDLFDSNAK